MEGSYWPKGDLALWWNPLKRVFKKWFKAPNFSPLPPYKTSQPADFASSRLWIKSLFQFRLQIIQKLEIYEEYLRKRSISNLYVPNKTIHTNKELNDTLNPRKSGIRFPTSTTPDELIKKKVDSKIIFT